MGSTHELSSGYVIPSKEAKGKAVEESPSSPVMTPVRVNEHVNKAVVSEYIVSSSSPSLSSSDVCDDDNDLDNSLVKEINKKEEEKAQPLEKELKTINIGTEQNPREIQIGATLNELETEGLVTLLKEFQEVFAWTYEDMPGIDPKIVQHHLPLYPDIKPVKQKLRRLRPQYTLQVKEEVMKQLEVGFIEVCNYSDWLANVVIVPKKTGKIRVCVDYRDLNKASPKDDFPLPKIDILVDNTAGHQLLSFMDGFSGYNQIKMAPEDKDKTAFITDWGTYRYTVMPFGLKNAGATYQRAATTILHDLIHKEVEVYVDDMIVKSPTREGHLDALRSFFQRIKKYKLRLNPQKCTFGVTAGKLLGFMISQRGIEIDPSKIRAITEMPSPKNEKEIRGFLGRIQYISRFISHLTAICEPIFKTLKKDQPKKWNPQCQLAFDKIRDYLANPPVLVPPTPGKPLLLYLSVLDKSMGAMMAQHGPDGRTEHAIYYLSKKFMDYETRYSPLEKTCVALVWATKKLRHYLLAHSVTLISRMDPIKYLFEKPALTGRLAKWLLLLSEFDITYASQKSIKGSTIAEHLSAHPVLTPEELEEDFPDEDIVGSVKKENEDNTWWQLYFDGAANQKGFGAGILIITPDGLHLPLAFQLNFQCTNNIAEYEACIAGLEAASSLKVEKLQVYGDSSIVICQVLGQWKAKDERLKMYQEHAKSLMKKFKEIKFKYLQREDNRFADALAILASIINFPPNEKIYPFIIQQKREPALAKTVNTLTKDGRAWFEPIKDFIRERKYPENVTPAEKKFLRRYATQFILFEDMLYKRSFDGIQLLCIDNQQARIIMEEVHDGVCGPHMNARMMVKKIMRLGYYWQTMEADCADYVKKCHKCQIHGHLIHVPPSELHVMNTPWPFVTWGIDVIGKIHPRASNRHEFILVAIDYFTKWVEAQSYAKLSSAKVAKFIQENIICRHGLPQHIISDQGVHFRGKAEELCDEMKIAIHKSSPYRPQTNGAVEAANKNLKTILRKMINQNSDWAHKLPFALWAYRTSIRTSTGATPYSLVYGMEAVLPMEIQIPSLRVLMETRTPEEEWSRARFEELNLIDEKRLKALDNQRKYQQRMAATFNKMVKPRDIQVGDLVLKEQRAPIHDPRGKFSPNWYGPYFVKEILPGGAIRLTDLDNVELQYLTNLDQVKKYHS